MTTNDLNILLTKYPLLQQFCIRRLEHDCFSEAIPPYFAFILAVLDHPGPPVCFVFPKRGDAPRSAAVLFALLRFKSRETELAKKLGEKQFKEGDLVRIHPTRHVYRYVGFNNDQSNLVALQTLDGTGKHWLDPAIVIPRLEITKARRPLGKLDTIGIQSPPPSPLDILLGTSTFGNHSLIETEIVVLDAQNEFSDFVASVALEICGSPSQTPLLDLVPFGDLNEASGGASWFHKWDERCQGEPLIAVTHSAQIISDFCASSDTKSRLIVVNGLSRLKGVQTYDDISDTQHLVIFCDQSDFHLIDEVGGRGCKIWYLNGPEIIPARNETISFSRGVLSPVGKWACNHELLRVEDEACGDSKLDEICLKLRGLGSTSKMETNSPTEILTKSIWRLLIEAAGLIATPNQLQLSIVMQQINGLRAELAGNKAWLLPKVFDVLMETIDALEVAYKPDSCLGTAKGTALYKLIRTAEQKSQKWIVLTKSPGQVPNVNLWLNQHHISMHDRVISASNLPDDEFYDQVICLSWFSGETLKGVAEKMNTPLITVLSYTFERVWVRQAGKQIANSVSGCQLTERQKSDLLGLESTINPTSQQQSQTISEPVVVSVEGDSDIWLFERRLREIRKDGGVKACETPDAVSAWYIGFVGDLYAYLTETHQVSVATELVLSRSKTRQKLPERVVANLVQGDYVVFPESSERELVYELADRILGESAVGLRKRAHAWKDALTSSKLSPEEFLRQAKDLGRSKHIITIRNWFFDSAQIGPGGSNDDLKEDIELIELVTDSQELKTEKETVLHAIKELRSAHLSAGMRLRDALLQKLPQVIGEVEEKGTRVDLGELGSAWVVQVENIATESEMRERSQVNRLIHNQSVSQRSLLYV